MAQTINAVGWECPKPIIETKRLLDTLREGTVCTIVDNKIALDNLIDFGKSLGYGVEHSQKGDVWEVYTTKPQDAEQQVTGGASGLVVVVASDLFGVGDEEFSSILMKTYLSTLPEAAPLPETLIFMNRGVFFSTEDSPVEDALRTLEAAGVEIISCGACLDFYGVKDRVIVGKIGNMYAIVEKMNRAGSVVRL